MMKLRMMRIWMRRRLTKTETLTMRGPQTQVGFVTGHRHLFGSDIILGLGATSFGHRCVGKCVPDIDPSAAGVR
jgi:hypothetical protein